MRFAFFGTPQFAATILDRLLAADMTPELVVTQPDAVSRRGSKLWPSAVANRAEQAGLPLDKPNDLRDPAFVARLAALELDCVILAAYGRIIPSTLLETARHGWVNVHASLLPRWRGAAPIQRAILAGDEATGVSIMRMEAGLDTGPFCSQARVDIGTKESDQLEDELAVAGARLLIADLPQILGDTVTWHIQDESQVTYADKIGKHELDLSPEQTALVNAQRVRASSDSASARLTLECGGKEIALRALSAEIRSLSSQGASGTATPAAGAVLDTTTGDHLALICAPADGASSRSNQSDYCAITRLQPAGKRPQGAADFLRGLRMKEPLTWR